MRATHRLTIGLGLGPLALALAVMALFQVGCPHNPSPAPVPVTPDAADASRPKPVVNPEPGPVPSGNATKCAVACRHADEVCDGSLSPCVRHCTRAGGADPGLIPCIMAAHDCETLRCDPLARAAR